MTTDQLDELTVQEDGSIRITVKTSKTMGKFFVLSAENAQRILRDLPHLLDEGGSRTYETHF